MLRALCEEGRGWRTPAAFPSSSPWQCQAESQHRSEGALQENCHLVTPGAEFWLSSPCSKALVAVVADPGSAFRTFRTCAVFQPCWVRRGADRLSRSRQAAPAPH